MYCSGENGTQRTAGLKQHAGAGAPLCACALSTFPQLCEQQWGSMIRLHEVHHSQLVHCVKWCTMAWR